MRLCPTVEGAPSPLITHRIGAAGCQAQQSAHFHKCHRCIYRGKPADWVADEPQDLMLEVGGMAAAATNGVARPAAAASAGKKPAQKNPAADRQVTPAKVAESDA